MSINRRTLMRFASAAAGTAALGSMATAATFPSKPITIIFPFPAGSPADVSVRVVAEGLGQRLGVPIVIDNRSGANGGIGATAAAMASNDGHTIFLGGLDANVLNHFVYQKLGYAPDSFEPVSGFGRYPGVLAVKAGLPVNNGAELIALARSRPDELTFATGGVGGIYHLIMAMLEKGAGLKLRAIHYRGFAPLFQGFLGGQTDIAALPLVAAQAQAASGRFKVIGALSATRTPGLDLPTLQEEGFAGVDAETWFAFYAPKGTPIAVRELLNREIQAQLRLPAVAERLVKTGMIVTPMAPAQLGEMTARESDRWGRFINSAGMKALLNE
jgi:tripartite-type tricarboxylate transporter receptor subunit TctC